MLYGVAEILIFVVLNVERFTCNNSPVARDFRYQSFTELQEAVCAFDKIKNTS